MSQEKSKHPVNLPKTAFEMRGGLAEKEPKIAARWEELDIHRLRMETHRGRPTYTLHDGPPYANGDIHAGTAMNKILKDIINRYKYLKGFQTPYVPGWDCHGLPIEQNTLKELKLPPDALPPKELRAQCRAYAERFIKAQMDSFIRLGVTGDWKNPYLTLSNRYEGAIISAFGKLVAKGLIYRGLRPIYWSPASRTALAEAEIEYHDHTSPTIYVLFPIAKHAVKGLPQNSWVMIWTTTPWTMPSNLGVCFHPEFAYEAVTADSGQTYVLASALKESVLAKTGAKETASLPLTLDDIKSLTVMHPWIERESAVVFADYVTADTGTGIVHTAPGHGAEDFQTGQKYGLEVLSPLDDRGCFTEDVPQWQGMMVFDANPRIVQFLKDKGRLYYTENIVHAYPHDWRTKTPVIFRAKAQWFYRVSSPELAQKTLEYLPKISWTPAWGEGRLGNMLQGRPDWCISRQRKWGVPIIAFYCETCGEALIDGGICESIAQRVAKEGLDFWFDSPASAFLPKGASCPCGGKEFRKEEDILDVWFDSGSSHYAVLTDRGMDNPADLYLEGSDQYRGWFQSSLWNSMGLFGRPPFKAVLSHGWMLDENGRQMHKSAGNSVSPSEITDRFGADILRLWVVTEDFTKDLRIGPNIIQKTVELYRKLRNTFRYLLGSLDGFYKPLDYNDLEPTDKYILHRLAEVRQSYERYMDEFAFHRAYREIFNFAIIDLSGFYFDILKDRLYILSPSSPARLSAQTALFHILTQLTALCAPALVFTTEEVYGHAPFAAKKPSVHLEDMPPLPGQWSNPALAEEFAALMEWRKEALEMLQGLRDGSAIGSALDAQITITSPHFALLKKYEAALKEMLIVSQLHIADGVEASLEASPAAGVKCARCWHWEPALNGEGLCPRCAQALHA